jgi:tripartite-type tricarboxylate transporter receptor subunit TctC
VGVKTGFMTALIRELGYDIVEGAYRGVAAPPGTPDDVVKILANAFDKVMKDPEVQKKMDQNQECI